MLYLGSGSGIGPTRQTTPRLLEGGALPGAMLEAHQIPAEGPKIGKRRYTSLR